MLKGPQKYNLASAHEGFCRRPLTQWTHFSGDRPRALPSVPSIPLGAKRPHVRETNALPPGSRHRFAHMPQVPSNFPPWWQETGAGARAPTPSSRRLARTSPDFAPLSGLRLAHFPRFPGRHSIFGTEARIGARARGAKWHHVRDSHALPLGSGHNAGSKRAHVRGPDPRAHAQPDARCGNPQIVHVHHLYSRRENGYKELHDEPDEQ